MNSGSRGPVRDALGLLASLALAGVTAAVGGRGSADAAEIYTRLEKPSWAPPAWVFGPVWTALYAMMAVAAWWIWRAPPSARRTAALGAYAVQLVLNALWSWLFFAWGLGGAAFIDALLLAAAITATLGLAAGVSRAAAWCLVPYLAWTVFASALTFVVWRLNPAMLR